MKLCTEDKLLHELLRLVPVPQDQPLGPGDDCAAIKCGKPGTLILLKTDCIAEDVHFLRSHDPAKVGWKALCRPLSDIAAMGGTPAQALITFFSPPDLDSNYWKKFYRGLGRAARRFGVTIAGGEMSRQKHGIAVSVMLTGHIDSKHLLTRSGGKPGDLLFVTGQLGGSIAGHHLNFTPRLQEGQWLAKNIHPSAMMDISDGLGTDLPRLARASGCGFEINPDKPASPPSAPSRPLNPPLPTGPAAGTTSKKINRRTQRLRRSHPHDQNFGRSSKKLVYKNRKQVSKKPHISLQMQTRSRFHGDQKFGRSFKFLVHAWSLEWLKGGGRFLSAGKGSTFL
ncbi:MAG: thiamine-phosphate kinase [Verrucomicrobia bacterium]|nr:thiamine-phosphate kinase [Verrucomicrobiota bacterium]